MLSMVGLKDPIWRHHQWFRTTATDWFNDEVLLSSVHLGGGMFLKICQRMPTFVWVLLLAITIGFASLLTTLLEQRKAYLRRWNENNIRSHCVGPCTTNTGGG